jgi:hypothetical protein
VLAEKEPAADQAESTGDNAEPESEDTAERTSRPEEEPAEVGGPGAPVPLVLALGLAGFTRDLVYTDNLSQLPEYNLGLGPSLVLNLNWYPAAHFSRGAGANIGLDLRALVAFGLDSEHKDNTSFPTSANAFGVGVRGRLPLGKNELAAIVGYGKRSYSIGKVEGPGTMLNHPYVPSTSYSFMRIGIEGHFPLSDKFALGASLAYLPTFSTGTETWFANTTANGIEGEIKAGYTLSQSLDVNAAFGLQRFAMAFNPKLADAAAGKPIAGGAVDQYLSLTLSMLYRFAQ